MFAAMSSIVWPGGARCAAAVTFDVDSDSILHLDHPSDSHRRVGSQSWLRYDEVAVPAILEMYERLGLRQTFFVPGWCIDHYPHLASAVVEGGHELAAHGYMHELAHRLRPEQELELMQRAIDAVVRVSGERPRGWRGPLYSFSDRTADLLASEAFAYDSSLMAHHLPYRVRTDSGTFLELPSDWANDDWPQYAVALDFDWLMPVRAPDRAFETFEAEFEAAYAGGWAWIGVWHPFVSGRPARLARVERFLTSLLERSDVWVARLDEIARHLAGLAEAGEWNPTEITLPYQA
jgi:peptidoglycan/xylan/chitin deacetylase (PgdA/CDA1 family)